MAGERLYNGIVLPDAWPPKEFSALTREPQPLPYLDARPEVAPIDVGRQLFVDDFLIEKSDLRREWHYPEKYAGNPVLKPETQLEMNRPGNSAASARCGGVWWDPNRKTFRMWYDVGWLNVPGYAESPDGISWHRVECDVVPGTNRLFPAGTPRFDCWAVSPDFTAKDPYSRWLLFVRPPGPQSQDSFVATSDDGIHWSELRRAGKCGDASIFFYNPFRRKWVFSLRSELGPWGKGGSRVRSYREADDFLAGSQWDFRLSESTDDVVLWLQPDRYDHRDPGLKRLPQLYYVAGAAYESVMLGALSVWKGPENDELLKHGMPKINDLCFAFSRDGFHFDRGDRTPAIAAERWASGKWDAGYVLPCPSVFVVVDEKLVFYYGATAGNPERLGTGGFTTDLNGCYDRGAAGIATLRRDGFASLRPGVGRRSGEMVTRPVTFSGKCLFVNADVADGAMRVEVQDVEGNPIAPYTAENCRAVSVDSTKTRVVWNGAADLAPLAGRPVRFRFAVESAKYDRGDLYAFWVSKSDRGESGGYLGGGGRDYAGSRDL